MSDAGNPGNSGPLGGLTNSPQIDRNTLIRQQAKPRVACGWDFQFTAWGMLQAVHAAMDEYAQEIFDLWFSGKATPEVIFDNQKWAAYMRAEERLQRQITAQLLVYAEQQREKVNTSTGPFKSPFSVTFHAEVGSEQGEYRTGYDVLHGSNKSAGDCVISGKLTAVRSGPRGSAYTATYEDLSFVFNDVVDINKTWKADVKLGQIAANMAWCLETGSPKDYVLRIKWRAEGPIKLEVGPEGKGPAWLKQFPNR